MANNTYKSAAAHALRVPRTSPRLANHRKVTASFTDRIVVDFKGKDFLVKEGHVEGSQEYQKFYRLVQQK